MSDIAYKIVFKKYGWTVERAVARRAEELAGQQIRLSVAKADLAMYEKAVRAFVDAARRVELGEGSEDAQS